MNKSFRKWVLISFFTFMLFWAVPVSAAAFKTVHTNTSWPVSSRKSGGAVFSSEYTSSGTILRAQKSGKTVTITNSFNGGTVISDGKTAYYCAKTSDKWCLYKANVKTGSKKKIGVLATSGYNIDLAGIYKNQVYYIIDVPEGTFAKFSLKNKSANKLSFGKTVSIARQTGKYFVLADGTGAGYSYLGLWNAASNKFKTISKKPVIWYETSKYVYFVEYKKSGYYFGQSADMLVKRYKLSNGQKKTITKSFNGTGISQLTAKYVKYYTSSGSQKTIRW
ncbi:MAG: hypothetical protein IJ860_02540 [Eubacterium sp.]|nr:hypothetical protein [Eubacterium sp.]